jgi:hypothetical protein
MMTNELLRRYAVDGSESAFTKLLRHYIDLVYSAALRQVNGEAGEAQDITQAVFTEPCSQSVPPPRTEGAGSIQPGITPPRRACLPARLGV